jgi:cyanobactin biosynthesis protein (PatB/AcyB/McaB family)
VTRPDIVRPADAVDTVNGSEESVIAIKLDLMLGANFNDPPAWRSRGYDELRPSGWSKGGGRW